MGAGDGPGETGLALEAAARVLGVGDLPMQHLDRDDLVEPLVVRPVDVARGAAADVGEDLVAIAEVGRVGDLRLGDAGLGGPPRELGHLVAEADPEAPDGATGLDDLLAAQHHSAALDDRTAVPEIDLERDLRADGEVARGLDEDPVRGEEVGLTDEGLRTVPEGHDGGMGAGAGAPPAPSAPRGVVTGAGAAARSRRRAAAGSRHGRSSGVRAARRAGRPGLRASRGRERTADRGPRPDRGAPPRPNGSPRRTGTPGRRGRRSAARRARAPHARRRPGIPRRGRGGAGRAPAGDGRWSRTTRSSR